MPPNQNPIEPEWINLPQPDQKRAYARKWIVILCIASVTLISMCCIAVVTTSVSFRQLFGLNSGTPAPPATRFADLPAGEAVRLGSGGSMHWVESVRWSPDGQFVAAGAQDSRVWLWSARDEHLIRVFGSSHREASRMILSWSPDGRYLAIRGDPVETVQIWSVANGRLVRNLTGTKANINSISYAPDGQYVAAGLADGTICIWLAADGRLVQTLTGVARDTTSIHWAPDATQIAAGTSDGQVLIWNIVEARVSQTLEADQMDWVYSVSWSPDGTMIAAGSTYEQRGFQVINVGTVLVWTVADSKLVSMIQADSRALSRADSVVQSINWSPDSSMLVSDYGGKVRLSTVNNGQIISVLDGHTAVVEAVDWSPDGTRIASGSFDGTIVLWNVKNGIGK